MTEIIAGRYELVREIGRGASATVYRAHDSVLDRYVAIKLVAPALANDPDFVDRFMREARLSARLQHPNVATVHDVGETEAHQPFLAMALVEGESLEAVIRANAPVPLPEALRILRGLGSALDYLHGEGLIHRDVKPSNILIEESGRVVLSDFGIAYAREAARFTNTGVLLGTPRYMAPEQFTGEEPTVQTDVYALGVVAFEMLSGAPPFEGSGTGLMYRIVHEPPPPITSIAPNITPGIEAVIARALSKDPAARWSTPGEFVAAITDPDANATMVGATAAAAVAVPAAALAPEAVSMAEADSEGATPAEAKPPDGPPPGAPEPSPGGGGGGGRRTKTLVGTFGAGLIGLGIAGFCVAAGGINPAADDDANEPEPTVTPTPGTPAGDVSPSATATPRSPGPATTTPSPLNTVPAVETAAATNTPGNTVAPPPPPPSTATSVSTATVAATATAISTPAPAVTVTPTATATATRTPTPTATSTPSPTATATPTATPTMAPPTAPSNVVRSSGASNDTLSWSDNSNNEQGFRIYWRATDLNSGQTSVEQDKTVGANVTSTTVAQVNLIGTTTGFGRGVSAYNAAGESPITWE